MPVSRRAKVIKSEVTCVLIVGEREVLCLEII